MEIQFYYNNKKRKNKEAVMEQISIKNVKSLQEYKDLIKDIKPLDENKEYELLTRIRNYDKQAEVELYNSYANYVYHVAKAINNDEFDLLEIIDVGNNAVEFAIESFVMAKGSRSLFKNYITWLIDKNIKEAIRLKKELGNE